MSTLTDPGVDRTWNTLTEFVEHAVGPSDMAEFARSSRREESGSRGWFQSANFADAQGLAFNWPEGADRVNRLRALVSLGNVRPNKTVEATRKAPGRIHMGRVMAGNPYGFVRTVDAPDLTKGSARNVVDILVNACVSSGVSTETIEARGAAMLALAEALEQSGKRVRITVGMANEGGGGRQSKAKGMLYRIVVKQPGQPLNLNSVAFAVAHPSFFRRFIFSAMERENETVRRANNIGGGYGYVAEFPDVPKGTIYMGGADLRRSTQWSDPEFVKGWIREKMREQGIEIADK